MNKPGDEYVPSFLKEDPKKPSEGMKISPGQEDMLFVKKGLPVLVLSRGYFNSAELVNPAGPVQVLMFVAGVYVVQITGEGLAPLLYSFHERRLSRIEEGKDGVTKIEWERV